VGVAFEADVIAGRGGAAGQASVSGETQPASAIGPSAAGQSTRQRFRGRLAGLAPCAGLRPFISHTLVQSPS
jgi:hypothetical protein